MRNLHIRLRQWVLLASIVTALVTFAIVVAFFSQDKGQKKSPAPSTTIHLQNDSFNEEHFVTTYGAKVTALEKEMAALSAQMKREDERKKREKQYATKEEQFNAAFDTVASEQMGTLTPQTPSHSLSVPGNNRGRPNDVFGRPKRIVWTAFI